MWYRGNVSIEAFKGLTFKSVVGEEGGEEITFITDDDQKYVMYHEQDCCEFVNIDDICGDLNDLVGSPILLAEEVDNTPPEHPKDEFEDYSFTWTFYKLATNKGGVTIRWYGTSNGYYSESVSIVKVNG